MVSQSLLLLKNNLVAGYHDLLEAEYQKGEIWLGEDTPLVRINLGVPELSVTAWGEIFLVGSTQTDSNTMRAQFVALRADE